MTNFFATFLILAAGFVSVNASAALAIRPSQIEFGTIPARSTAFRYVNIRNESSELLDQLQIPQGNAFFFISSDCQAQLQPMEQCTLRIEFTPTRTSGYFETIKITSSEGVNTLYLSGSGHGP